MCFISALFYDMISKVKIKKNLYNFNLLLIIKLYIIFMNLSFQINLLVLIFLSILIHLFSGKYEIDYRISDQIFVILLQNSFIKRHCFFENTPVIVFLVAITTQCCACITVQFSAIRKYQEFCCASLQKFKYLNF